MDRLQREMGLLVELALGADDLRQFEALWIERLRVSLGFDTACSVWTGHDGAVLEASSDGYDELTLRQRFPAYMSELSAQELAGFCAPRPAIDTDVVSRGRRQRLTVYRELLAPLKVTSFITNVWPSRFGVFGFHFARARPSPGFGATDVGFLSRVAPCIKLGQALLAAERRQLATTGASDWWASSWRLSPRETEVASLAARGFSNPEIGELLRVSRHTVRNQLANVFVKADVSSRAELVFVMSEPLRASRRAALVRRDNAWRAFVAARDRRGP